MALTSGASHGIAAFASILLGAVVSEYLAEYSETLHEVTFEAGRTATAVAGLDLSNDVVGMVVISSALAFVRGVAYHLGRH